MKNHGLVLKEHKNQLRGMFQGLVMVRCGGEAWGRGWEEMASMIKRRCLYQLGSYGKSDLWNDRWWESLLYSMLISHHSIILLVGIQYGASSYSARKCAGHQVLDSLSRILHEEDVHLVGRQHWTFRDSFKLCLLCTCVQKDRRLLLFAHFKIWKIFIYLCYLGCLSCGMQDLCERLVGDLLLRLRWLSEYVANGFQDCL